MKSSNLRRIAASHTLCPPQAISSSLCCTRELLCRRVVNFDSLSRTVAARLLKEVYIEFASGGDHVPQSPLMQAVTLYVKALRGPAAV